MLTLINTDVHTTANNICTLLNNTYTHSSKELNLKKIRIRETILNNIDEEKNGKKEITK